MNTLNLKNKNILVMGLGLLGGGVATTNWLLKRGAKVRVTDLKTKAQLYTSLRKIKGKTELVLGQHRQADFLWAEVVIQNPGVPRQSKYLKIARKHGAQIENEATVFFKTCPAEIIGVTGTRGKSTTSTLIYEMLKAGLPKRKVWLAGNIQITPMLEILDKVKRDDLVVLELSSWHLENLGGQKLSPPLAVITNIYPDHLNRYQGMKDYISAKKNIFRWQNENDFVVLNKDNLETEKIGKEVKSQRFWFSKRYFSGENGSFLKDSWIYSRQNGQEQKIIKKSEITLMGEHNLENVLAAATVAGIYGVSAKNIKPVLKIFRGLKDRLELIREIKGVKYYNDTTATTPEATIAALKTLGNGKKKIILIAGGSDKGLVFDKLAKEIKKYCKAVILLKGRGTEKIKKQLLITRCSPEKSRRDLGSYTGLPVTEVNNMADAVGVAQSFARRGNIILLSPACASFGLFKNEFDRGERFIEVVNQLTNNE